jgi:hypothetical protein
VAPFGSRHRALQRATSRFLCRRSRDPDGEVVLTEGKH